MKEITLSDQSIAQIAKVLQLAILTGTDIIDNLRQMKFVINDSNIEVSPDYIENFDAWINKMTEEINSDSNTENSDNDKGQLSLF